jgi:hypothetical protein
MTVVREVTCTVTVAGVGWMRVNSGGPSPPKVYPPAGQAYDFEVSGYDPKEVRLVLPG